MIIILFSVRESLYVKMMKTETTVFDSRDKLLEVILLKEEKRWRIIPILVLIKSFVKEVLQCKLARISSIHKFITLESQKSF